MRIAFSKSFSVSIIYENKKLPFVKFMWSEYRLGIVKYRIRKKKAEGKALNSKNFRKKIFIFKILVSYYE